MNLSLKDESQISARSFFFGVWDRILIPNPIATIFYLSYVLQEAKPAFSVFSSDLSLAVVSYVAPNLQPSFLFLT
jgi:hypothetical protein